MRAISRKGFNRAALIAAVVLGSAALTGCYEYGYNSVSVYQGGNYRHGQGHYNQSYGNPYWGWRGNYYYPGVGNYVYDRDRRPHRWNDDDRRHWEGRRSNYRGDDHHRGNWDNNRGNWDDFDGGHDGRGRGRGRGY